MTENRSPQCLFFPDIFPKRVVAQFDQRQGSSDGGAILLKAADRGLQLTEALAAYDSSADALLEFKEGKYRFTEITVHPQVALKSQADVERAHEIMESAHANCFVSNSITCSVKVLPEFRSA